MALQTGKDNLGETATRLNRLIGYGPLMPNLSQVVDIDSKGNYVRDQGGSWGEYMLHMAKVQKLMVDKFGVKARNNAISGDVARAFEEARQRRQCRERLAHLSPSKRELSRCGDLFGHAAPASSRGAMEAAIIDYLDKIIDPFLNPQKRVYVGYLIAAVLVAIGLSYLLSGKSSRQTLSTLFARRIWWSKSARTD